MSEHFLLTKTLFEGWKDMNLFGIIFHTIYSILFFPLILTVDIVAFLADIIIKLCYYGK